MTYLPPYDHQVNNSIIYYLNNYHIGSPWILFYHLGIKKILGRERRYVIRSRLGAVSVWKHVQSWPPKLPGIYNKTNPFADQKHPRSRCRSLLQLH